MHGPDQSGLIRVMADGQEIDRYFIGFEDDGRATDAELADPAVTQTATRHDPFGIAPRLELEETANDEREFLREILDRSLHDAGGLRIALREQRIELFPADLLGRLVPKRIVAGFAPSLCRFATCAVSMACVMSTGRVEPNVWRRRLTRHRIDLVLLRSFAA